MFDQWVAMEAFYYQAFPALMWVAVILGIIFVVSVFNLEHRLTRWMAGLSAFFLLVIAGYSYLTYQEHADLINLSSAVGPGMRDYQYRFFLREPYGFTEKFIYRNDYFPDPFEKVGLYEIETFHEPVDYLGTDGQYYYFQVRDAKIYCGKRSVQVSEDFDQVARVGKRYWLKDGRFQEIGFVDKSSRYHDYYALPEAIKDKPVSPEDKAASDYQIDVLFGWLVP